VLLFVAAISGYLLIGRVQGRDTWLNPWADAAGSSINRAIVNRAPSGGPWDGLEQGWPDVILPRRADMPGGDWRRLGCSVHWVVACFAFTVRGLHRLVRARPSGVCCRRTGFVDRDAGWDHRRQCEPGALTGVTAPFVSYGGSSLLMSFIFWSVVAGSADKD
jgi:hypothetical protein